MRIGLVGLAVAALVCAGLAYLLLADGDEDEDGKAPITREPAGIRFEGRELPGTVYLLAGEDALNADLYRVRGSLDRVERLTRNGRVSVVAAHGDVVVVSNARGSGSDRLEVANLEGGDALPGRVIDRYGQAPDFSPSGKLLYSVEQYTSDGGDAGTKTFVTRPRPGAKKRLLYASKRSTFTEWGPGERVAAHSYRAPTLVLDPDGPGRQVVNPGLGRWSAFETSNRGLMFFKGRGRFAIVPPDGPTRRFESPWDLLGWSPDSRSLLATRGGRLALVSPEDGSAKDVGRVSGGKVFIAEWIAEASE